jgi:hypothetical protein
MTFNTSAEILCAFPLQGRTFTAGLRLWSIEAPYAWPQSKSDGRMVVISIVLRPGDAWDDGRAFAIVVPSEWATSDDPAAKITAALTAKFNELAPTIIDLR